jgi:hypothetical protein
MTRPSASSTSTPARPMTTSALEQPSARSTLRLPQRTRTRRPPARNRPQPRSCIRGKQQSRCRYRVPCNSGAPAVVSRARRALLLSCAQGSVADSRRGTPAPDDLRARVAERSGRPQTDGSRREPTIRSDDSCSSAAGAPPTDARALALGRERASCARFPRKRGKPLSSARCGCHEQSRSVPWCA